MVTTARSRRSAGTAANLAKNFGKDTASLRRDYSGNLARIFTIISAIVFVVTLIPDVTYIPTVPGSTPAQTAILMMMHVVAASVILRLLTTARKTSV